jgi:hypothetical protein
MPLNFTEVIYSYAKGHGDFSIVMYAMLITPWIVGKLHHNLKVSHYKVVLLLDG